MGLAYKGQGTIQRSVGLIWAVPVDKEMVVVDGCSADQTWSGMAEVEEACDVAVRYQQQNKGKGAALRTGFNTLGGNL